MAPLFVLVTSRAGFLPVEQQPQPGPCEALYSAKVFGAWALRSLVACAFRLSDGMQKKCRRGQDHARRFIFALRAVLRVVALGHRPHVRERAAIVAEIFVDGHLVSSRDHLENRAADAGRQIRSRPASFSRRDYLSWESGIWMSPVMCLIGPADDGMMSKSKISVGSHSVAQAFGTSTTPEMWPWHGAVPRIE